MLVYLLRSREQKTWNFTWVYSISVRRIHWGKNCKPFYNYVTENVKIDENINEAHYRSRKRVSSFKKFGKKKRESYQTCCKLDEQTN